MEHQEDDPANLLLAAGKYPGVPIREVAAQIKARQKAKNKIPSWYQDSAIIFPPALSMEQCSSESTAKLKSEWLKGDKLVDLTGGAGVDTYFLSRRFNQTCYVEKNPALSLLAKHNFARLQAAHIQVHTADALDFLKRNKHPVDWIYIDPARRNEANTKVFRLSDCQPDVTKIQETLFQHTDNVLVKTSPMLDIKMAVKELGQVRKIYVVAVKNEVKEVLYALCRGHESSPDIEALNVLSSGEKDSFSFNSNGESAARMSLDYPQEYLYEPNAAILKAGGFRIIGEYFNLSKLHQHSHLFTSNDYVENFPGRKFKILAVCKYDKKEIQAQIADRKANITTRNFPYSVDVIRKKTRLKPGGDTYVFATTNMDRRLILLVCNKISPVN
ncbi:RsmD family RNA methyltransferase [Fulvivirgaceae bacterium BMA12]|uniref:RsmD family RNA methyltransferase n=1 Tax=Agaribacillus aureus TaxID=3051825 RepID=A0ABT8LH41_9BACT|nr:RsmD family RNA methyltransferase [Fulvivirgaceae bacterium BMA12]